MKKKTGVLFLCSILVISFFAGLHLEKVYAAGNFINIDNNYNRNFVNSTLSADYWISYNDGYCEGSMGLTDGGIITMAIGLTDVELSHYRNYVINELNVAFGSDSNMGYVVDYEVWIEYNLPTTPYCGCINVVATGTSTGEVWNLIDIADTLIPATRDVFVGINIETDVWIPACGFDESTIIPDRAGLITYQGYGMWSNLGDYGFPSVWGLDVGVNYNYPPNTPDYLNPSNHERNVDVNASLLWTCTDPDGDNLAYDVYFGTSSNPSLVSKDQSGLFYTPPGSMSYNTKYYWKIVAKDKYGAHTIGPIWDFITGKQSNNPPNTPSNPIPINQATDIDVNINLGWTGGDPDIDDTVTYDVYFGSMLPLEKFAGNISKTNIKPGTLSNDLTYYWNVVAWDNHGASTIGPGWYFTTIKATNNPPNKPTITGKVNGKANTEYEYRFVSIDPEEDEISYNIDWGDNIFTGWTRTLPSGEDYNSSHIWSKQGNYIIKARAKDTNGAESDWASLDVSMPRNRAINPPFIRFLQQHPILFQLFQRFLTH